MKVSDEKILGLYVPRGLSPPIAEGEQIQCARASCGRAERTAGARAYRWGPRELNSRPVIELCPRCHKELATIISGG